MVVKPVRGHVERLGELRRTRLALGEEFGEHPVARFLADLFDKDRTDVLIEAIREYIEDTADSETFQELVAARYYDDQLDFETVKQLVGAETL